MQSLVNLLDCVRIFHCLWQNPWNSIIFRAWILSLESYFLYLDVLSAHQWSSYHLWNYSETTTYQTKRDSRQEIWLKYKLYCNKNRIKDIYHAKHFEVMTLRLAYFIVSSVSSCLIFSFYFIIVVLLADSL